MDQTECKQGNVIWPARCLTIDHIMAAVGQNATLSPIRSPTSVKRKGSSRKRAVSQLPPVQTPETHEAALRSIRSSLRKQTSYDVFPVSFRLIVLDTKLEVKKALQCLLHNGACLFQSVSASTYC